MDPMKDALAKRRGKGLDLTILLGGEPIMTGQAKMNDDSDMAPPPAEGEESAMEEAQETPAEEDAEDNDLESADKSLISGMSDYDKTSLQARKPKSLGEHARMGAMNRLKK